MNEYYAGYDEKYKSIICEMLMMWNRKDGKTHLLWMYQNIQQPQAVRKLHLSLLT